jgi:Zn-dependent oligopeptidase
MSLVNVLLNYNAISEDLLVKTKKLYVESYESLVNYLIQIPNEELSWLNFIQPLIDHDNTNIDLAFLQMKDFSTDEKIRELCSDLDTEIDKWSIEQSMRKDLYLKYKYYWDNQYQIEQVKMTQEQQSYLTDVMIGYKMICI